MNTMQNDQNISNKALFKKYKIIIMLFKGVNLNYYLLY